MSDIFSLFLQLRRRYLRSDRGAVADSAVIFLTAAMLVLAFGPVATSVSASPGLHHIYLSLQDALQSTNDGLRQGPNSGALISGLHDTFASVGRSIDSVSADLHRLLQSLFQQS